MAYSFKIKMWTDILKNNWQSWHKSAVTSVLQHSLFLYYFSKCPNKCKVPRNKMHITNETLISKKTKYYIFTEFTGPGNESKMWNLYTWHKTLVQISENIDLSHCRELSLHSLFNQNSLTGITALDVILVHILFYYVKTPDFFLFT